MDLGYLAQTIASGDMVLFTGAGFSADARGRDGRPVPTGRELADALYAACFPGREPDGSSLQDLYQHALHHCPEVLDVIARERLRIAPRTLPESYRVWFSLPWRRIYTLNVDDLERAVAARFPLPHRLRTLSALRDEPHVEEAGNGQRVLDVVHLNGWIDDAPHGLTFSTTQYGTRLAERCAFYRELVADMSAHPFLFVGTRLDEAPLWQHIELAGGLQGRPRSYLVTPALERARRSLLAELQIEWVALSTADFTSKVLIPLTDRPRAHTHM